MTTEKLSRREREIMDVLYALGDNAAADEIREQLTDPASYSAVRAMLAKLEAKGVIRHRAEGLRYVYSTVTSRTAAQKKGRQPVDARVLRRLRQRSGHRAPQAGNVERRRTRRAPPGDRTRAQEPEEVMIPSLSGAALWVSSSLELSLLVKATLILVVGLGVTAWREGAASVRHLVVATSFVALLALPIVMQPCRR